MALQNRVLPTGEIVATPERGSFMGNRGILHDAEGRLGRARWKHAHWITCRLAFKGHKRAVMAPGAYTELFFLDEAVALAAGHRPCAECRRAAYRQYRAAFEAALGPVGGAGEIDRLLQAARVDRHRRQVTHAAPFDRLPDGAFITLDGESWLIRGDRLRRYTPGGYGESRPRPRGSAIVLTPAPSVAALARGYRPELHPSARD